MSNIDIIRAWKDEEYRNSLSEEQRSQLPENPAGMVELSDEDMEALAGGYLAVKAFEDMEALAGRWQLEGLTPVLSSNGGSNCSACSNCPTTKGEELQNFDPILPTGIFTIR